ncbi:MAG: right-handed parallel beta-helix repeat-containing protein [Fibrobacteres bacterium]|nr:right-handed parallel beta-helix repeat-containing protein [Fibrobacterota bacterium]
MAKVPSGIRRETVAKAAIFPETFASYAGRCGRFRAHRAVMQSKGAAFRRKEPCMPIPGSLFRPRLTLLLSGALLSSALATAADFYVSPSGDDTNPGTLAAPFKTLTKARDAVRGINANQSEDIHVYLRGGTYPIAKPIEFTPADGGTGGHRIVYEAYGKEIPVLNGGTLVTGWTLSSGNVYKATLDRATKLRSLIVNDKRAYMTKKSVGSKGGWGTYSITSGQASWAWKSGSQFDGIQYLAADVPELTNPDDVELVNGTTWNVNIVCVRDQAISGSNRILKLQQPFGAISLNQGWTSGFSATGSHTIQNAYEFLNAAGNFYFNKATKTLYYYKRSGEDMSTAVVYAPATETLLKIQGTSKTSRVQNLTFKGITFANTEAVLPAIAGSSGKTTVQGSNWCIAYANSDWHADEYRAYEVMSSAINVSNASSISLEDNVLAHIGNEGIGFINDVVNSKIIGNAIYDVGGSAIQVGHPQHIYETSTNTREKYNASTKGICRNTLIKNNLLYDMTTMYTGHTAIQAYFVDSLAVVQNHIEKLNYVGVSIGWGWCNFDSIAKPGNPTRTSKRNSFSNNRVFDCMKTLNDGGALYTLGSQPGSSTWGNYVKASTTHFQGVIHPDEGTAWYNGGNMVFEITPGQDNAEINDWGRKHDNHYDNIYTTSSAITTGGPRCTMTNIKVYPNANWPAEAQDIIKKSGLESTYQGLWDKMNAGLPLSGAQARAPLQDPRSSRLSLVKNATDNSITLLNPDQRTIVPEVYATNGQRLHSGEPTNASRLELPAGASHGIRLVRLKVDGAAETLLLPAY